MTTVEIRRDLQKAIDQLSDEQLRKLYTTVSEVLASDTKPTKKRKAGTMKGLVTYMADDFDAPLDDFKDYMVE